MDNQGLNSQLNTAPQFILLRCTKAETTKPRKPLRSISPTSKKTPLRTTSANTSASSDPSRASVSNKRTTSPSPLWSSTPSARPRLPSISMNSFEIVELYGINILQFHPQLSRLDGKSLNGNEIKVKFAHGGNDRRGGFQDRGRGRFGGDRGDSRGGYQGRGGFDGPRRDFGDRPRGCFNCGEQGHMIKDCPKPKKPREFNNREGGFERRPYDNNREGGQRRNYGGDNRGGYDRGNRGRDNYGGDRRGGYENKRRGGRSNSSRSRSNDNKGGRRQRSSSSRS